MGLGKLTILCLWVFLGVLVGIASAQLSTTFYSSSCPNVLATIKTAVNSAVSTEARMGASLLRLHFHDCFVNGCDASVLLDGSTGEKSAGPNNNSLRGFDVIDTIKSQVENLCAGVVSCADILTVAARDATVALGGPSWSVPLGRRDSTTASASAANSNLPSPAFNLSALITSFSNKGFTANEMVALSAAFSAKLSPNFYDKTCPGALATIKSAVDAELMRQQRMGASLLRLFFHDCFIQTCDGSNLLDPAPNIDSEKNAIPNANSVRGYDVIDRIRLELDKTCGGPVVSCADIVAVAARDSVVALGGPTWEVQLGRRDSINGNSTLANINLPSPIMNLTQLIANFNNQGLDVQDLVTLSGAHTIGLTHCGFFQNRIYNETNIPIDPAFARLRQRLCPNATTFAAQAELAPLDLITPRRFDTNYFSNLVQKKGLLDSDQELYNGGVTDGLVKLYSTNQEAFFKNFARSMVKMGNFKPLTGNEGQIRNNCRRVNP